VSGSGGKLAPGCDRTQTGAVITVPSRPRSGADDLTLCGDDTQDWPALTRCAARVHTQFPDETQVILTADPQVEYEQIICAMDALRAQGPDELFPNVMLSAGVR
jgi:biopolymer transport protein TolR